jgi:pyruvate dehydrogenase E2 component (dihydrolipoamide acetyltransferase)
VVAPVIRDADVLDLAGVIRARAELVERARSGSLRVEDLADATMTLTNVGPVGGDQLFPVLTPPQVTVIGVGREDDDGAIFTFTGDHRVLDGADGARFLTRLAEVLDVDEN